MQMETHIKDDEQKVMGLEVTVNNTRSRYQLEIKRRDETSPVRQLLNRYERVRAVVEEAIPALFLLTGSRRCLMRWLWSKSSLPIRPW